MIREIPFDKDAVCDVCGTKGAYDFMGDYYCQLCISRQMYEEEDEEEDEE